MTERQYLLTARLFWRLGALALFVFSAWKLGGTRGLYGATAALMYAELVTVNALCLARQPPVDPPPTAPPTVINNFLCPRCGRPHHTTN